MACLVKLCKSSRDTLAEVVHEHVWWCAFNGQLIFHRIGVRMRRKEGKKTSNTAIPDAFPPGENSDANRRARVRAMLDMAAKLRETREWGLDCARSCYTNKRI